MGKGTVAKGAEDNQKAMEREVEEENDHNKHGSILAYPDWLDLPEPIATNIILEHLEIIDYIIFPAVCKKWQSIQKEHRSWYSPYPPPLRPSFPWLTWKLCIYKDEKARSTLFYLPNEQKSYHIHSFRGSFEMDCTNGWFLLMLKNDLFYPYIFNPITAVQIYLPPLPVPIPGFTFNDFTGRISSPPIDPNCTIIIKNSNNKVHLYRLNDNAGWKTFSKTFSGRSVFCRNNFYNMAPDRSLLMIDPLLLSPAAQTINMDCSEICESLESGFDLVDFLGELVLLIIVYEDLCSDTIKERYGRYKEFHIYLANFLRNKWVKMETLGDQVLFYSSKNTFAVPAVDVGRQKNTIYSTGSSQDGGVSWGAFDLSTRGWIDGPPLSLPNIRFLLNGSWFLPTL